MADNEVKGRSKRRSTGKRGTLRRFQSVESAIVEDSFTLTLPSEASDAVRSEVQMTSSGEDQVGDGCYVSATVHNRRYYGVLIDQAALKAASLLYFQDEANSLNLNRRMKTLQGSQATPEPSTNGEKRPALETSQNDCTKRARPTTETEKEGTSGIERGQPVQKFRFVADKGPGYRVLLATYADIEAASEEDETRARLIEACCLAGGGFVGDYYYQYQVTSTTLQSPKQARPTDIGIRTSMGLNTFLQNTPLPVWFPLSNMETGQHRVLSFLQMKKNRKGDIEFDDGVMSESNASSTDVFQGTLVPMEPRTCFRIGIIGGGISGLACATELFQQCECEHIDLEVILLEGRSRLGGRLLTDEKTFTCNDGKTAFPVDLGASWIHGIDHNPLATLARESGVDFVTASEDVKMLTECMQEVDPEMDDRIGKLFDDLLDQAAEDCWEEEEKMTSVQRDQASVRWYAEGLPTSSTIESSKYWRKDYRSTDTPPHRVSSDMSIDRAIGDAILKHKRREFEHLTEQEHTMLLWNTKNLEYALGANVCDLSMKFWDSDDRHAFEGDHVLLRQGFSSVVNHLRQGLHKQGRKFQCVTGFQVSTVEYSRKSTSQPYQDRSGRRRKLVDLSDTCCVTSKSGSSFKFDFVVCTLPLGVLKESVEEATPADEKVIFKPKLPFPKEDAIRNVGFGHLNKVYLQFGAPFWRDSGILDPGQSLFGNASGVNPHYYMFFDVGVSLGSEDEAPAVLMTLISAREAVEVERKSDKEVVADVVQTLRVLFSESVVKEPVAFKVTRWGSDKFSRGCYSFLPPGATDQDFQTLQSPVNGNGDSLVLEGSETMRMFWAGEHTTSLHPSTAHGAMLSGIRAAKEVISNINFSFGNTSSKTDKLIPLAIFRKKHPDAPLNCSLCHLSGSREREGSLFAFQRGTRQVLVHNNCAEFSPEVGVDENGTWSNVIQAINRSKKVVCTLCGQMGATVGCTHATCFRSYHFSCAEDTGWRFGRDGKVYFCDLHRSGRDEDGQPRYGSECDKISLQFYRSIKPSAPMKCSLCGLHGLGSSTGKLLAFQQRNQQALVHDNCARFTNLVETLEDSDSGEKFRNIFDAIRLSRPCSKCSESGATIACVEPSCSACCHFNCCLNTGWHFDKKKRIFRCEQHRVGAADVGVSAKMDTQNEALFQHNLFSGGGDLLQQAISSQHSSHGSREVFDRSTGGRKLVRGYTPGFSSAVKARGKSEKGLRDGLSNDGGDLGVMKRHLSPGNTGFADIVTFRRASTSDPWHISFKVTQVDEATVMLSLEVGKTLDNEHGVRNGDTVASLNGSSLGSPGLQNLDDVLSVMRGETKVELGLISKDLLEA